MKRIKPKAESSKGNNGIQNEFLVVFDWLFIIAMVVLLIVIEVMK